MKNYNKNWTQQARMENSKIPEKINVNTPTEREVEEGHRRVGTKLNRTHEQTHIRLIIQKTTTMQRQTTEVGKTAGARDIIFY